MRRARDGRMPIGPLTLASGRRLDYVEVAYAHYGELAADGRNALLVTHGYTASHRMLAHGGDTAEGPWGALIGPGKPLDTDKYFVVCSNMLGSSYGTTGPGSIDPATGARYGANFPDIVLADIVQAQHRLLQGLGVTHLKAVVGPSFGGFQALQWALDHPDWVDAIGVVLSAPYMTRSELNSLDGLLSDLSRDPAWQDGNYADPAAMVGTLERLRRDTMASYGMEAVLAARGVAEEDRPQRCRELAAMWAREFDARSLVVLLKAALAFDVRDRMAQVRADVLYVISDTDRLFPPDASLLACMRQAQGKRPTRYVEMRSDLGHMASGMDHALWSEALAELLAA